MSRLHSLLDAKGLWTSFYAAAAYFFVTSGLEYQAIVIYAILILLDVITGVWKAYKLGEAITSKRGTNGVIDKLLMLLVPLVIALIGKGLYMDFNRIVVMSISILIVYEGYSVLSNIYTIHTGEIVPESTAITRMLKYVISFMNDLTDKIFTPKTPQG